jgi:hypothetical protein
MGREAGRFPCTFFVVTPAKAGVQEDVADVNCDTLAIGIADRDVFTAGGVTCRASTGERGRIEMISARGGVFTFIMHLQAGAARRSMESSRRQFVGLPRENPDRPARCFVYTRYSGTGSSPNGYRHQLVGVSCSEIVGSQHEWSDEEIDDLLTSLRYNF